MAFVPASHPSLTLLAARSMLDRLDAMAARADGVRTANDVEDVHQMRVASRRLRSALRQFRPEFPKSSVKAWSKTVRRVTKSLGPARDLDVQILFVENAIARNEDGRVEPGLRRLALRLRQRRESIQPRVVRAMDGLVASNLFEDLGGVLRHILTQARIDGWTDHAEPVFERARVSVRGRVESLLAYETFVSQPDRADELHDMRIEAKRLRYTLELFAPVYDGALDPFVKRTKKLQTLLGDLHDMDVWLEFLPRFLSEEKRRIESFQGDAHGFADVERGVEAFRRACADTRADVYRRFHATWHEVENAETWERLLDAVLHPPSDGGNLESTGPTPPVDGRTSERPGGTESAG
jgi:CHAD domain-containing protein